MRRITPNEKIELQSLNIVVGQPGPEAIVNHGTADEGTVNFQALVEDN